MSSQTHSSCGSTLLSPQELAEAEKLFKQQVLSATSGLSIVQSMAVTASKIPQRSLLTANNLIGGVTVEQRAGGVFIDKTQQPYYNEKLDTRPSLARRVVNSHLSYFYKFPPFREGVFTKDSLYSFLFFAVVENRSRMSYAKRVLRNLLSYVRRFLAENGSNNDRLVVFIDKSRAGPLTFEIKLTPESMTFFKDNPRGIVTQSKRFYELIGSIGDQLNNERLKNIVCQARRPRELVFSEKQNSTLLAFALKALHLFIDIYSTRNNITDKRTACNRTTCIRQDTANNKEGIVDKVLESLVSLDRPTIYLSRKELNEEKALFELSVAFLLGFLTGARVKSTVMRLSVAEVDSLVGGATIEKLTKGSFARVFLPEEFTCCNDDSGPYDSRNTDTFNSQQTFDSLNLDPMSVARLLYAMTMVRRNTLLYPRRICYECKQHELRSTADETTVCTCLREMGTSSTGVGEIGDELFFSINGRQLNSLFDRVFVALFKQRRPKGVFWHSQRRRYLGCVNKTCGTVTASKSVGHSDVRTTMMYINNSMHRDETNRLAGSAIRDEMLRLSTTT